MKTFVISIFLTCFFHLVLTISERQIELLALLDDPTEFKPLPAVTEKKYYPSHKHESKNKPESKAREILLQNIQQSAQKAQSKEFIEDDIWHDSIMSMWDWLVSGMRRIASGMADLATQIMTS